MLLVVSASVSLVGCDGSALENQLNIAIFLGGYGQVWANNLARQFEAENEGVSVHVEATPELAAEIPNRLQNGSDDDIFFSHGIQWERMAVQGYIENLDDLYQQEVEDGITLQQRIEPSLLSTSLFNGHYYKLPWTNGAGGLVYNAKMFREHGWTVPTTYDELMALCETIYQANIKVDPTNTKPNAPTIKPFVWSQETYYWDYIVFDWWAQLAGTDFFTDYVKVDSPELFNPNTYPYQEEAFSKWVDLVAKKPWYSMEDSAGKQYMAAQMDFLNGYAAMIPCAQWIESEMSDNIDPTRVEMRMMPSPLLPNAKTDGSENPVKVSFAVGAGDSVIIPKNAPHKNLAKQFLLFLAKKDSLKTFTEKTHGVMLGMDYSDIDFTESDLTPFAQDVIDININSQKFNLYSNSLLVLDSKIDIEWAPENIQPYSTYANYYNNRDYIADPEGWLVANEKDIHADFVLVYQNIAANWDRWMNEVQV
jgi:N-acetylglucosamine transport system substrate-binding protein